MPSVRPRRRNGRRRKSPAGRSLAAAVTMPAVETKPIRGVKLKTVSWLTLLFALVCLGAFLAGRPPAMSSDLPFSDRVESRTTHHASNSFARKRAGGTPALRKSPCIAGCRQI